MAYFKNPNDPDNTTIKEKIKEWSLTYLNIPPQDIISIEEIPCWEPNCPDIFTKIVYTHNLQLKELIIRKPLVFVRKVDFMGIK